MLKLFDPTKIYNGSPRAVDKISLILPSVTHPDVNNRHYDLGYVNSPPFHPSTTAVKVMEKHVPYKHDNTTDAL